MRNLLLLITLISGLAGCSHESNFSAIESISAKEKPLRIITRILTTKSANFVQEFKRRFGNRTADYTRKRRRTL